MTETADSTESECSYSSASHSTFDQPKRRSYKRAAVTVKTTTEYADKRSRNNAAVQKFRDRNKKSLRSIEEDIQTYASLAKLFKDEGHRLEQSTKTLQDLLQKHCQGVPVSGEIQQVVRSEAESRSNFKKTVDSLEASLNDPNPEAPKKPR